MYRSFRLRSSNDFRKAREEGQAFRDRYLVVLVRPNQLNRSRFGFVASSRLGGAVSRNSVRRLMREAARQLVAELATGYDVVVIATRQAADAGYDQIGSSLRKLLRLAGLLGGKG